MTPSGLAKSFADAPVVKRGEYDYIIHPLLDGVPRVAPEMMQAAVSWMAGQRDMRDGVTLILAPEAMALPLAAGLGAAWNLPYVVARKREYGLEGEARTSATTGYSSPTYYLNDIKREDVVLVVDDVVSTGGTLRALCTVVEGMQATIRGALILLDKRQGNQTNPALEGIPIRAAARLEDATSTGPAAP